jgi:serine/threonine protein phosphatase 1
LIYVTSDLHGFPLSGLLRLLNLAGFTERDELIILGDVIDRNGDGGITLLRWMMDQPNVRMILGNHEAMMLSCSFLLDNITDRMLSQFDPLRMELLNTWLSNGAEPTLEALHDLQQKDPGAVRAIFSYLRKAPLSDIRRIRSRQFLLTHAGLGNFQPGRPIAAYTPDDLLWNRPSLDDIYFTDIFTVFGHTPTIAYGPAYADRMILTPTWADIDTGAASGRFPMLLRLDDMKPFYLSATIPS